ncbi:hypothetical protein V6Z11_A13G193600 [Gossypium hirsutum]
MRHPHSSLPPGFRFHPTDEELILHYLMKKLSSSPFPVSIIADVDIYKFDPWDLPDKAVFGEKEWYFFSPRDRKYPNGARPNRAAGSGYWKATGTDKIIVASSMAAGRGGVYSNIGVKKALVFYKGRPPKGIKTNWIMHEYRLSHNPNPNSNNRSFKSKDCSMRLDDWVLCRIYNKSHALASTSTATNDQNQEEDEAEQFIQDALLPALESPSSNNNNNQCNTAGYESSSFGFRNFEQASVCDTSRFPQKLPQLTSSVVPAMENKLKRPYSSIDQDYLEPPKKFISSCNHTKSTAQSDMTQSNFLNQSFFSHSLLPMPSFSIPRIEERF